ncbi:MAG: DUF1772 domain-containing protein [Thermoanaerobaculia bacterium]
MIDRYLDVLTFVAALGCALVAGIFYAFSSFVMKALSRLPRPQGIAAMQSINVAVLNPSFLIPFFGAAAACVALAVLMMVIESGGADRTYRLIGSLAYLAGTIFVTIAFNVPRNDKLASVDPASAPGSAIWTDYVRGWTAWNHVRAAAALVAAASLTMALLNSRSPDM